MCLASPFPHQVSITNIRAGRPKPGLASQHLTGATLLSQVAPGSGVVGMKLGSTDLRYRPGPPVKLVPAHQAFVADAVTAGAVTLMVQIALPVLALAVHPEAVVPDHARVELTLLGGTNVSHSPPVDHVLHVLLPLLSAMGVRAAVASVRRGFFPVGGGRVVLHIDPVPMQALRPLTLVDRGHLVALEAIVVGNHPHKAQCASQVAAALQSVAAAHTGTGGRTVAVTVTHADNDGQPDAASAAAAAAPAAAHPADPVVVVAAAARMDADADASSVAQSPRAVPCRFFLEGSCKKGHKCKFFHPKAMDRVEMAHPDISGRPSKQARIPTGGRRGTSHKRSLGVVLIARTSTGCVLYTDVLVSDCVVPDVDAAAVAVDTPPLPVDVAAPVSELQALLASGCCVDEYTADQLVVYMALAATLTAPAAERISRILVAPTSAISSRHLETVVLMATRLTGAVITVDAAANGCRLVTCGPPQ
jgi:RNA 3'-terminal phosphate cyclase